MHITALCLARTFGEMDLFRTLEILSLMTLTENPDACAVAAWQLHKDMGNC